MSRSYKKAIIKDSPRNSKKSSDYWRKIRSRINQEVRQGKETLSLPQELVNDYDYSDYSFTPEFDGIHNYQSCSKRKNTPAVELLNEDRKKYSRK